MKTDFLRGAACALVACAASFLGGAVQGQEIQLASTAELNNVYARLAELESRLATSNLGGGGCGCTAPACGTCCDTGCHAGCVGGVELLYLKAYEAYGYGRGFDFEGGYRLWAGWQRADGLGVRARYFDYDAQGSRANLDITALDGEIYDRVELGDNWDLIVGAGVRYLDLFFSSDRYSLNGTLGPVITAELYRTLSDRSALYAIGRESILFDIERSTTSGQHTLMVSELQLGYQMHRDWNGGLLVGRMGWEAQFYDESEFGYSPIALMGANFTIAFMR